MAEYKRQVSYIYLYEEGKKKNNIGYARVEAKNGQCKYTIHVTALGLNEKQLKIYAFRRKNAGIEGILLGTVLIKNNAGEFKIITDAANIMNSSYGMDDMGGIVLLFSERKFFATEWDSKPITMAMVANINKKEEKKPDKEESSENDDSKEMKAANLAEVLFEYAKAPKETEELPPVKEKVTSDKSLKDLLTPNLNIVLENEPETDTIEEEKVLDNFLRTEPVAEPDEAGKGDSGPQNSAEDAAPDTVNLLLKENNTETGTVIEERAETQNNEIENNGTENNIAENSPTENNILENIETVDRENDSIEEVRQPEELENTPEPETGEAEKEAAPELSTTPVFEDHPLAKQIYHNFPKMYPFEDNEIAWCARIEPKDIGMLPMELWGLGNNSFLLHGYYSYRHLIFARVNDKTGQNYILGVPGIYHNREKFMAKMFGFENFKCAKKKPQRTGEFGYWYIPVLLNRQG